MEKALGLNKISPRPLFANKIADRAGVSEKSWNQKPSNRTEHEWLVEGMTAKPRRHIAKRNTGV